MFLLRKMADRKITKKTSARSCCQEISLGLQKLLDSYGLTS